MIVNLSSIFSCRKCVWDIRKAVEHEEELCDEMEGDFLYG